MSKTIENVSNLSAAAPTVTAVTTAPAPVADHRALTQPGSPDSVANASGSSGVKTRPLSWYVIQGLKGLGSLRLTVTLFALSMLLVFFGTLAQIDSGIWTVITHYFRWFWVWVPFQIFVQFGQVFFGFPETTHIPGAFPFPGGLTLGLALLVNVLTAYGLRYRHWWRGLLILSSLFLIDTIGFLLHPNLFPGRSALLQAAELAAVLLPLNGVVFALCRSWIPWKRIGVLAIHYGMILMLMGELMAYFAVESTMSIDVGKTTNVAVDRRHYELAVISPDAEDTNSDHVTVVPDGLLRKGAAIENDELPFDVKVNRWLVNARLHEAGPDEANPATAGAGLQSVAVDKGEGSGVAVNQTFDIPACYATLTKKDGTDLGTYLFWAGWELTGNKGQAVNVDGKTYQVSLRFKHSYKPYALKLLEFRFDRYPGTDKPKNYSSRVRLHDEEFGEDREIVIRMNEPLRHRGETYYQQSFDAATERTTYLQVVRNSGWQLPYWSCGIVALGMIIHFGLNLATFLQRRVSA